MRFRRVCGIASVAVVILALCVSSALAAPPLKLDSGLVTDDAGVLGDQAGSVQAALSSLNANRGVQLFVVYVDSFDSMGSQEWADETARLNGLGLNDILLAVAVVDRQYAWSIDQDFKLANDQMNDVASTSIEPALQSDDWAGAAIAAAEGYNQALGRASAPQSSSGGGSGSSCLLPVVLIAIALGVVVFIVSKRKGKGAATAVAPGTDAGAEPDMKSLETQAGQLLVEVDDALRTSEQELGFAEAEFGAQAIGEYAAALATSKEEVAEAFRIQQRVFDAEPEDDATRRQMLGQIIELAQAADARLDEKAEAFAALRDVSKRLDDVLGAVSKRLDAAEEDVPAAVASLAGLRRAFTAEALGEVADNDTEASGLIALARQAVAAAGEANSKDDKSAAAIEARKAEEAVAQAEQLLQAVSSASKALGDARKDLEGEVTRLEQVAATAEAQGSAEVAPLATVARQVVAQAKTALAAPSMDPVAELEKVRAAAAQIEAASGAARDAAKSASDAIGTARQRIASVEAYVQTRRAGVGTQARSSLTEANRRLARAQELLGSDPAGSLGEAQAALQYAESASRYAQGDVAAYDRANAPASAPAPAAPPAAPGSGMPSAIAGAVIGSVLRGAMSGGGSSSRSSFGGSGRRSGSNQSSGGRRGGGGRF